MNQHIRLNEIQSIKTQQDSGNILVKQIVRVDQEHITGLVSAISEQIKTDYDHKTKDSQVFDGEQISLIAEPVIKNGFLQSATTAYLMWFPDDEELTEVHPKGYCPRMHIHPLGERNMLFFVGKNSKLLIQSLSPIILENDCFATLSKDVFLKTNRIRYHALVPLGFYLVRLAANTSHNFVALGSGIATISFHPNEYEEVQKLRTPSDKSQNISSQMQNQTIFLQDEAGTIEDCYPI